MPLAQQNQLRAHFLAEAKKRASQDQSEANQAIAKNLEGFFSSRAFGLWAAYRARPEEASLEESFPALLKKGITLCFPRVIEADAGVMDFFLASDLKKDFERHPWGMLEPKANCQIVPSDKVVGVFVPLLAFDIQGTRLGKGRAFYDRYLEAFPGKKIGIAFEWQFCAKEIPREAHDIALDAVVTERKIHRF